MNSQGLRLAQLFLEFPGMLPWQAEAWSSRETVQDLLTGGYLTSVPTVLGDTLILSPAGRAATGADDMYEHPTVVLEDSAYLLNVVLEHVSEGFKFDGRHHRTMYRMTRGDVQVYIAGTFRGLRRRTVSRYLSDLEGAMLRDNGKILIVHPQPAKIRNPVRKSPLLKVKQQLHSGGGTTRQRGIPSAEPGFDTAPEADAS